MLPDGLCVVYRADQDANNVQELYSVVTDGSAAPVKLSAPLVGGGDVKRGFVLTPDGQRVVYRADQDTNERVELYLARIDGKGEPIKLNGALIPQGNVSSNFVVSADGTWVLYHADQDEDEVFELFAS